MKSEDISGGQSRIARLRSMASTLLPQQNTSIARKQFKDIVNTLPIFLIFQIAAALATSTIIDNEIPGAIGKTWFSATAIVTMAILLFFKFAQRGQNNFEKFNFFLKTSPVGSVLLALLWAMPPFVAHIIADRDVVFLLFAIVLMVMVIGASSIVRLPIAAISFVFTITTSICINMPFVAVPLFALGFSMACAFALGLISIIALSHESFIRNTNIEIDSAKQSDVIKLLLNDFERGTSDWLWETDTEGKLVYFSPRLATVFGQQPEGIYGKKISHLLETETQRMSELSLAKRMSQEIAIIDQTIEFSINGNVEHYQITAHPLKNQQNKFSGYRGVGRDVTVQFNHDAQIKKAKEDAETANASKSQFLAVISHELRTPINAIVGFSEVLNSDQGESLPISNRREYLATVQESARHLQGLINDILDATRIERGTMQLDDQYIDAAELVETAVKICRTQATRGNISMVAHVVDDVLINGDLTRLKQVVLNLLSNAIKFSPEGGIVNIDMQRGPDHQMIISIRDAGVGIKPEDAERIFEPFAQAEQGADRKFGGMGLGLAIARKIARLHGGDITLEGEVGLGAEAKITMPKDRVRWSKANPKSATSVAA